MRFWGCLIATLLVFMTFAAPIAAQDAACPDPNQAAEISLLMGDQFALVEGGMEFTLTFCPRTVSGAGNTTYRLQLTLPTEWSFVQDERRLYRIADDAAHVASYQVRISALASVTFRVFAPLDFEANPMVEVEETITPRGASAVRRQVSQPLSIVAWSSFARNDVERSISENLIAYVERNALGNPISVNIWLENMTSSAKDYTLSLETFTALHLNASQPRVQTNPIHLESNSAWSHSFAIQAIAGARDGRYTVRITAHSDAGTETLELPVGVGSYMFPPRQNLNETGIDFYPLWMPESSQLMLWIENVTDEMRWFDLIVTSGDEDVQFEFGEPQYIVSHVGLGPHEGLLEPVLISGVGDNTRIYVTVEDVAQPTLRAEYLLALSR